MSGAVRQVLDHMTDGLAIVALAWLSATSPEPLSAEVVGGITSIAIGQRYAKHKWSQSTTDESQ